jgi:hypothetical protein
MFVMLLQTCRPSGTQKEGDRIPLLLLQTYRSSGTQKEHPEIKYFFRLFQVTYNDKITSRLPKARGFCSA